LQRQSWSSDERQPTKTTGSTWCCAASNDTAAPQNRPAFLSMEKNRLVMPAIVGAPEPEGGKDKDENEQDFKNKNGNRGGGPPGDHELDPLLIALRKKILDPEKGWPGPSRVR
jgi:hypothetical protein